MAGTTGLSRNQALTSLQIGILFSLRDPAEHFYGMNEHEVSHYQCR